jgi:hypothetical protein
VGAGSEGRHAAKSSSGRGGTGRHESRGQRCERQQQCRSGCSGAEEQSQSERLPLLSKSRGGLEMRGGGEFTQEYTTAVSRG